jgi:hypothetical protein
LLRFGYLAPDMARRAAALEGPDDDHAAAAAWAGMRRISWHFERDPIPYALETDWPVGHVGFEPANPSASHLIGFA